MHREFAIPVSIRVQGCYSITVLSCCNTPEAGITFSVKRGFSCTRYFYGNDSTKPLYKSTTRDLCKLKCSIHSFQILMEQCGKNLIAEKMEDTLIKKDEARSTLDKVLYYIQQCTVSKFSLRERTTIIISVPNTQFTFSEMNFESVEYLINLFCHIFLRLENPWSEQDRPNICGNHAFTSLFFLTKQVVSCLIKETTL